MPKVKANGKFRQEKNGTWTIDTKVKVNNEFKHLKRTGFRTLTEAKNKYPEIEKDFITKLTYNSSSFTINELVNEYTKTRNYMVNITTLKKDEAVFKCHIIPYFNNLSISEIFTQQKIKNWYEIINNSNQISDQRKTTIIARMKDFIKFAYTHKYISGDAYQDCDVILYRCKVNKKENSERVIWTEDEEKQFLDTIKNTNNKDYIIFLLMLTTGLRIGEFLGLQGKSYDYKNKRLIINQQVVYIGNDGWTLTDKLKTFESYRTVILPTSVNELLHEYIINFNIGENDFIIFACYKEKPMSRTDFRKKLDKYCNISGVRKLNPHALRHNQAVKLSRICKTMDDIENAARRLGHSPSMFANTYAKHQSELKQAELLDRIYKQ